MKIKRYRFWALWITDRQWNERIIALYQKGRTAQQECRKHFQAEAMAGNRWLRCVVRRAVLTLAELIDLAASWGKLDAKEGGTPNADSLPEPLRSAYFNGFNS